MRAMLNEAMVNDWILVNPFKKVRPGELISIADERKRETILTPAQEKVLLAACATHWRRHLVSEPRGSIPANLWHTSYVVFLEELLR